LIIKASPLEREALKELASETGEFGSVGEADALEELIANSELDWISPDEMGDLTSAPMLGLRDEEGRVTARWAFMDYQIRSFVSDLIETGKAIFIS
jgi:hypothetical protein